MGAPGGRTQAELGSEKAEVTGSEPRLKEKRKQGQEQVGTDSDLLHWPLWFFVLYDHAPCSATVLGEEF